MNTASQIRPHPSRPDWFVIPKEWGPWVAGLGTLELMRNGREFGVHRTYLPVLAQHCDAARAFLDRPEPRLADRQAFDAATAATGKTLRGYQHEAREFALRRDGVLLGDQMRLGKSATAISIHDPSTGPLVVVAPLATREVWTSWMRWRWPDITPTILTGKTYDRDVFDSADLIFVHYDVVAQWQSTAFGLGRRIGTLILDEIHLLSNAKSKRSLAVRILATRSIKRVGLTGTPMWNKPIGLYTILSVVAPGAWGTLWEFGQKYCDPQPTPYGTKYEGATNSQEFKLRMSELMIRRTWRDVLPELPAIERTTEIATLTAADSLKIDMTLESMRTGPQTVIGDMARLRKLLGKFKIASAIDCAERVMDSVGPVVVWIWHVDIGMEIEEKLSRHGYPTWLVTGGMSQDTRAKVLDAWRAEPVGALVMSIPVGQAGIDLSHASQAVFAEQDWTPAVVAQSEMRTFHPDRPMSITYIVADHPMDQKVVLALQKKCAVGAELGMPAAEAAVERLAAAFSSAAADGDLQRLADAIISAGSVSDDDDDDDDDDDY